MLQSDTNQSNILIVDDKSENLKALTYILTKQGYTVYPAINGRVALKAVQKNLPISFCSTS